MDWTRVLVTTGIVTGIALIIELRTASKKMYEKMCNVERNTQNTYQYISILHDRSTLHPMDNMTPKSLYEHVLKSLVTEDKKDIAECLFNVWNEKFPEDQLD